MLAQGHAITRNGSSRSRHNLNDLSIAERSCDARNKDQMLLKNHSFAELPPNHGFGELPPLK
jgi:hypothetical protein